MRMSPKFLPPNPEGEWTKAGVYETRAGAQATCGELEEEGYEATINKEAYVDGEIRFVVVYRNRRRE